MIDIKPNLAEAVAFAASLPTDQAHLCAIHPAGNRPVVGRSFPKTEAGQAAALRWLIEADRKGYGIYFNANEVKPLGKGHAKAKEAEVSTVRFLHVDADLPAGTAPDDVETRSLASPEPIQRAGARVLIRVSDLDKVLTATAVAVTPRARRPEGHVMRGGPHDD